MVLNQAARSPEFRGDSQQRRLGCVRPLGHRAALVERGRCHDSALEGSPRKVSEMLFWALWNTNDAERRANDRNSRNGGGMHHITLERVSHLTVASSVLLCHHHDAAAIRRVTRFFSQRGTALPPCCDACTGTRTQHRHHAEHGLGLLFHSLRAFQLNVIKRNQA